MEGWWLSAMVVSGSLRLLWVEEKMDLDFFSEVVLEIEEMGGGAVMVEFAGGDGGDRWQTQVVDFRGGDGWRVGF